MPTYSTDLYLQIEGVEVSADVEIEYRYLPGSPAFTYPGEYAPTDPPEPAEVDIVKVTIRLRPDGPEWPCPDWLFKKLDEDDDLYRTLCREGEEHSGPDPDAAYDAWRDEQDSAHGRDYSGCDY